MKFIFSTLLLVVSAISQAQEQAEAIFEQYAPSLYQIRLIDKASGEKSSIGSGFQIAENGLIATNYHVISGFARHPDKYHLEFLDNQGNKAPLILKSVDVTNDLALVKRETQQPSAFFNIANQAPIKGEELYSLGNPNDLGMIVVPGTYNGLKADSFSDRIHFTGSVNSGMSGGPVVNKNAEVVGINVATSGNQIGWLVPHDKLKTLYQQYLASPPASIEEQMKQQLYDNQEDLISTLLDSNWELKQLGGSKVPVVDVPFVKCWGESNADKTEDKVLIVVANCALNEDTYVSNKFYTGTLDMEYLYLKSKSLSPTKFYQYVQARIKSAGPSNDISKDDATEFECQHDLVASENNSINNKAIFCARAYKDYDGLFDVVYLGVSIDKYEEALISHFALAGVSQESAQAFMAKFMEAVSWK